MKIGKSAIGFATVFGLMTSSVAVAAETTRSATALPTAADVAAKPLVVRSSRKLNSEKSGLLGAPLFLAFLGAVVITIGTIIIVNNNDSPG